MRHVSGHGDDEEAKRITGIVSGVIAGVAATITGAGLLVGALSGGLVTITASTGFAALAAASGATGAAIKVVDLIRDELASAGYTTLGPNTSHRSHKMMLSLWQQCHVVRVRRDGLRVYMEETHMRPIFSGPTDNSVNTHDVCFWARKYPYRTLKTFEVEAAALANDAIDGSRSDVLVGGQYLQSKNDSKIRSQDGRFNLCQQSDSHLVLYHGSNAIWSNNMWNRGVDRTIMQSDGNLVSYTASGQPVWSSGTHGNVGAYLILQNDGNLVIYLGRKAIWASNTYGR
ncbi:Mannose-specific lectin [Tetrabaena socialis]|uniref:Mannose-specific lectin n=1 Tax=Tetrabaena socialis TaxID=47790 RepID=A0A2J7ZWM3_9CHLO|nr:Mannose-specific lectin [Tetrabaena socialis]|eukprot:PNH04677.1 Mannose-specific lectin [Tetrabaena socialis]